MAEPDKSETLSTTINKMWMERKEALCNPIHLFLICPLLQQDKVCGHFFKSLEDEVKMNEASARLDEFEVLDQGVWVVTNNLSLQTGFMCINFKYYIIKYNSHKGLKFNNGWSDVHIDKQASYSGMLHFQKQMKTSKKKCFCWRTHANCCGVFVLSL